MIIREATLLDADRLRDWRNDPFTCAMSRNPSPVGVEEHLEWFRSKLNDPCCYLGIAEDDMGEPVGTIRLDRSDPNTLDGQLSWTVAPEFRRRGIGKRMVQMMVSRFADHSILAHIRVDNIPSMKIALSSGMVPTKMEQGFIRFCYQKNIAVGAASS
jgi:RimJ/RimL family protein N-acetyltransferase